MIIKGTYHLTATEKRHIQEIVGNGWLAGSTKRKRYEMEKTANGFIGKVYTKERRDNGQMSERIQRFTVTA